MESIGSNLKAIKLPRLTPSSVNDLGCSKKFWTLRVMGQWPSDTTHSEQAKVAARFGTAFHAVMRDVYSRQHGLPPNTKQLDLYVSKAFYAQRYITEEDRVHDMQRCKRIVLVYVTNDDEEDCLGTIDVERSGEFDITYADHKVFSLLAKLDRILVRESDPTRLIVRDYKSSKPYLDTKKTFIQLWTAKLLYPGYVDYSLELDWVTEDERIERDVIPSSALKGMYQYVRQRAFDIIVGKDHPAEPGDCCTFCPLRPTCQPSRSVSIDSGLELVGSHM